MDKGPLIEITLNDQLKVKALVDTGSTLSLLSNVLCDQLSAPLPEIPLTETLTMFDGTSVSTLGTMSLSVEVGGQKTNVEFHRVHQLPTPVLLGIDFIQKTKVVLDFGRNCYWTENELGPRIQFPILGVASPTFSAAEQKPAQDQGCTPHPTLCAPIEDTCGHLSDLLADFPGVLSEEPGHTEIAQHHIEVGDATPVRRRPYRLSGDRKEALNQELRKLMASGKIEPSSSPWAAPVVMVPKKSGEYRMCIDYRGLNAVTKLDAFPMPTIDAILESLHGSTVFTSLDLRSGYWQMAVAPQDREKQLLSAMKGCTSFVSFLSV